MQKYLPYSAKDYHVIWGHPVSKGSRLGVAILVHKAKAWHVKPISLTGTPCQSYYEQGRLVVAQVVAGSGNRSFIIYAIYGHAGARWDADRKKELKSMLKHSGDNVASRGATPAFITGDFNIQVTESLYIQSLLRTKLFMDAKDWGTPVEQIKHTSHKQNGSRIDLCLANQSGSMLLTNYKVCDGILLKDHSELHIDINLPIGKQWRNIPVQPNVNTNIPYDSPPRNYIPPSIDICAKIGSFLSQGDIDKAFATWCSTAEDCLKQIPHTNQNSETTYDTGSSRGKIRFQKQCMFPNQPNAQTLNLHARRIAQALSRARDLLRANLQLHQSHNTWKNLAKAVPSIPEAYQMEVRNLLKRLDFDNVQQCCFLLESTLREMQQSDKKQRIKAWKSKLAQSEKIAYQWLRNKQTAETTAMTLPTGEVTADITRQLEEVFKVWQPIFQKISQINPDSDTFKQHFVPHMKSHDMHIDPNYWP